MKKSRDTNKYILKDAIAKVIESSKTKFDSSVELHANLDIDPAKQPIRFQVTLPNGSGKSEKIAVLSSKKIEGADLELKESDIAKIEKGEIRPKFDFDIFITEPSFMSKIASVAKVLGPAGVMPNPKTGTVTDDVIKAVEQFKKGKIEIRTEKDAPIIHTIVGKCSFKADQLEGNIKEILKTLKNNRPQKAKPEWIKSVYLASSMGPSFRVDTEQI